MHDSSWGDPVPLSLCLCLSVCVSLCLSFARTDYKNNLKSQSLWIKLWVSLSLSLSPPSLFFPSSPNPTYTYIIHTHSNYRAFTLKSWDLAQREFVGCQRLGCGWWWWCYAHFNCAHAFRKPSSVDRSHELYIIQSKRTNRLSLVEEKQWLLVRYKQMSVLMLVSQHVHAITTFLHTCARARVRICMYVFMYACVHASTHVSMYACTWYCEIR